MTLLRLFLGFLKVGCFSFGGAYSAIPLIREVVLGYGWMDEGMLADMIAVSESTPGPIMVNLATYVGTEQAGFAGACVATLAVILPAFAIVLAIAAALSKAIGNVYVRAALNGLMPCAIGIVLAVGLRMAVVNLFPEFPGSIDFRAAILTAVLAMLYFGTRLTGRKLISPIALILISALLGAVVYAF